MFFRLLLIPFASLAFAACADDSPSPATIAPEVPDEVTGLKYVAAEGKEVATVFNELTNSLSSNDKISVVARVDHSANAASTGKTLPPTRVVLFGNPALGTPLMQANPQAGLDLPQKMLVYETGDKHTIVAYNSVAYLANRHGVGEAETLSKMSDALSNLATSVSGGTLRSARENEVGLNEGVVSMRGTGTVDSVYQRLKEAITGKKALQLVAELDHQANAASVGMELPPIRLIVFGNPALGTPLMQEQQSIGIDLPQKMLVYQSEDGEVVVAYNDPAYLAERHGVSAATVTEISSALSGLAKQALGQ